MIDYEEDRIQGRPLMRHAQTSGDRTAIGQQFRTRSKAGMSATEVVSAVTDYYSKQKYPDAVRRLALIVEFPQESELYAQEMLDRVSMPQEIRSLDKDINHLARRQEYYNYQGRLASAAQLRYLRDLGCDVVPLTMDHAAELIDETKARIQMSRANRSEVNANGPEAIPAELERD